MNNAKKLSFVTLLVLLLSSTSTADAYKLDGRIWTSTTNAKSITAYSVNIPSTYIAKINNSLSDWDLLPGSSLNTGTVNYTSSLAVFDNAKFTITRLDVQSMFGSQAPAITFSVVGGNSSQIYLDDSWAWSAYFDESAKIGHLRTVVTHELGHSWGIAHPWTRTDPNMTAAERASVMNATMTVKYTPNSDDIAAMAAMY